MGTRQLRILPYTGKRAYQYYIDGLKVNGKRQRLFFKDEKSAKAKLKVFTPKQLANLLAAAGPSLLPALALQAFAGLRTAEVLRLEWSDVDLVRGIVTVAAHKSKTARRRLIPIAQNLAEWLRPYAQMSGPVYSTKTRNYHADIEALRSSIGLSTWPNNGLRHSFASYHLAKHQNAPQLALEMGHSTPRMIFENYREVVAPAEAERYWTTGQTILPTTLSGSRRPYEPLFL
jgi:integrase